MKSNKMPYVIAGSAIGGAAAFLFMTGAGRRVTCTLKNFDSDTIPTQLRRLRGEIEKRTEQVSSRVDGVRAATRLAYGESGEDYRTTLAKIEVCNQKVAAGIHKSVDELSRTVTSLERSVLEPLYQVKSIAQAIKGGVKKLQPEREPADVRPMYDRERVPTY